MKKLVMLILVSLLTACGWFSETSETKTVTRTQTVQDTVTVSKAEYESLKGENITLKAEVKMLKDRPITEGLTSAQCTAMAESIVSKSCTAKTAPRRQNVAPPVAPPVAIIAPPSVATGSTFEVCRLKSDGTARLISNPPAVLPKDFIIAAEFAGHGGSTVIARNQGENCNQWRSRVAAQLVDFTNGSGRP